MLFLDVLDQIYLDDVYVTEGVKFQPILSCLNTGSIHCHKRLCDRCNHEVFDELSGTQYERLSHNQTFNQSRVERGY